MSADRLPALRAELQRLSAEPAPPYAAVTATACVVLCELLVELGAETARLRKEVAALRDSLSRR